jgi:hypothetical protein
MNIGDMFQRISNSKWKRHGPFDFALIPKAGADLFLLYT